MANQLCRSAETNHRIAESITVSHGNTSPPLSVFIKRSRVSARGTTAESEQREVGVGGVCVGMFGMRLCRLPQVARTGCNLESDKREIGTRYQAHPDLR